MKKVSEALEFRGIAHLQITGTATKKSNTLERFQNNEHARVLLLNVIDESASGAYDPSLQFPNLQEFNKRKSRHFLVATIGCIEASI